MHNPKNRNQFFVLNPDETGLLFLGNMPKDLPTNPASTNQIFAQNPVQQSIAFLDLAFTSVKEIRKMKGEMAAYYLMVNRYAVPSDAYNEILIALADNFYDNDALRGIHNYA